MATYQDIANALLSGMTTRQTAGEFGISPSTVSEVAKRGGMVYRDKVWSEPATGRTERTNLERITDFFRSGFGVLKSIILEPTPPLPLPQKPPIFDREHFDFGLDKLPPLFNRTTDDERHHMNLVVQIIFKDNMYPDYIEELSILQYDDRKIVRRTIMAKIDEVNREDIEKMYVWWDGELYASYDESDFEFGPDDEGDTP